jgi:hypothetical protein
VIHRNPQHTIQEESAVNTAEQHPPAETIVDVSEATPERVIFATTSTGRVVFYAADLRAPPRGLRTTTDESGSRELTDEERHLLGTHPAALDFARAHGSSDDLWIAEPGPPAESLAAPGDPDCPLCHGVGWLVERDEDGAVVGGRACECAGPSPRIGPETS